jgi:chemotaxis signal transduction protein
MDLRNRTALGLRGLVVFDAGDELLAAAVDEVAGLLDAERLAPLPGRVAPMAGVVAFRGSVVPTLDLALALGADSSVALPAYAVVFERGTDRIALLVRGMPRLIPAREVVELERAANSPAPPSMAPGDVADLSVMAAATAARPDNDIPVVLAVYDVQGRRARQLDYWSLMDSVAPPAAFRLSGLGSR